MFCLFRFAYIVKFLQPDFSSFNTYKFMKSLLTLTDPVYTPKKNLTWYDKLWLRVMNDKRDLPFIYLLTTIHLLVVPVAILLFTPLLQGGWWWIVAIPYFYVSQLYFKGRFGLMFHCICHRKCFKKPISMDTWLYHLDNLSAIRSCAGRLF